MAAAFVVVKMVMALEGNHWNCRAANDPNRRLPAESDRCPHRLVGGVSRSCLRRPCQRYGRCDRISEAAVNLPASSCAQRLENCCHLSQNIQSIGNVPIKTYSVRKDISVNRGI
jgi:hypothetical protein